MNEPGKSLRSAPDCAKLVVDDHNLCTFSYGIKGHLLIMVCVGVSHLSVGDGEESLQHVVDIIVLQVRVVSDRWIVAGLVPAEAIRRVVPVGKDPCWVCREPERKG